MDANSLKTDEDYNAALEEIERLMNAQPETPEGERLNALATLEAWEEKHFPIEERETRLAALQQALKEGEERAGKLMTRELAGTAYRLAPTGTNGRGRGKIACGKAILKPNGGSADIHGFSQAHR